MTQRRRNRYNAELNQTYIANQQRLRSEETCEFTRAVFTIPGRAKVQHYQPRWTADRDYLIKRAIVTAGLHVPHDDDNPKSHPNDGCPRGTTDLVVQLIKYPSNYDDGIGTPIRVFTNEGRLRVEPGTHRDTAWSRDVAPEAELLLEDEYLTLKVFKVGNTFPGSGVVVTVVLEPA